MHIVLVIFPVAATIGVLVAFAVMLMLLGIQSIESVLFTGAPLEPLPIWQFIAIPATGGLIVGLILSKIMPDGKPKGPADVIDQVANDNNPTLRTAITALLASILSIGSGASVGREGPAIHFAASLAGWVTRILPLPAEHVKTLIGCAVAAAVSASFNAPLAGVVFAHEVILGHYAFSAFAPVAVASLAGVVTIHNFHDDDPLFTMQAYDITSYLEVPAFMAIGVVAGMIAYIMIRAIITLQTWKQRIALPDWLFPVIAGAVTGIIAIWFPQVLGTGYIATDVILQGASVATFLAGLLIAKLVASTLCLGLGFAGGIFSPALLIGATFGALSGVIATALFPELASQPAVYTIVGMSAFASAVLGAPFSTCLIVLELTRNYPLTIAVLLAGTCATMTMQISGCRSYFHQQLLQQKDSPKQTKSAR